MSLWTGDIHVGTGLPLHPRKPSMETESCYSEQSSRSRRSRSANHHRSSKHRSSKGDVSAGSRSHHSALNNSSGKFNDSSTRTEEFIEVQILSQDDNWGDNTTAVTGSDHSGSGDDVSRCQGEGDSTLGFLCHMWVGTVSTAVLSLCAFLSPVVMIVLPKVEALDWKVQKCGPECDGLLLGLSLKLVVLALGSWALFFRRPRASLPRLSVHRALALAMVVVATLAFWLFYAVRIVEKRHDDYRAVVHFASSLVDALLFLHYLAVVLIEVRPLQNHYALKVVRSPDGESRFYSVGQLSIQRAAALVLENYYRDFAIYNPYLDNLPSRGASTRSSKGGGGGGSFKMYGVDGGPHPSSAPNGDGRCGGGRSRCGEGVVRVESHHNERFHEEHEYERRVRKRRARLVSAAEDAFTHIRRLRDEPGPAIPMDPSEAAQAIFPSMARPLQKYLRVTRQQPRHTMRGILDHLALCLSHDLSPRAFLEKYLVASPVLQNDRERARATQPWSLVCDTLLSRPLQNGSIFLLRQGEVSLLVCCSRLPHLCLSEEVVDPKSDRFVLRLNSETSV